MLHTLNLSDRNLFENAVDRLQASLGEVFDFNTEKRGKLREVVAKQLGFEDYQSYLGSLGFQDYYATVPSLYSMPYFKEIENQTQVIVWYMTTDFFGEGISSLSFGEDTEYFKEALEKIKRHETHRPVAQFFIKSELYGTEERVAEQVFHWMQGHNWSQNGEARHIIEKLGLKHTSMSCGDMVQIGDKLYVCKGMGFKEIDLK